MKVFAILLMFLGVFLIIALGFMYLLGFAMSFDAPGSDTDIKAWWMRGLFFLPIVVLVVVLILAIKAFAGGNYARSAWISSVFAATAIIGAVLLYGSSYNSMKKYRQTMEQEAEWERLYPIQRYHRQVEGGTDTIIVWPNRIVAYRLYVGTEFPYGGPLGDLNEERNTLLYHRSTDTKLKIEELGDFTDQDGRKFTDVYMVQ